MKKGEIVFLKSNTKSISGSEIFSTYGIIDYAVIDYECESNTQRKRMAYWVHLQDGKNKGQRRGIDEIYFAQDDIEKAKL